MKKILVIALLLIYTLSCSKNDSNIDPIIGIWHLKKYYRNELLMPLDECALMKTIEFKPDGYYNEKYYKKDNVNNCIFDGEHGYKWSVYNSNYSIDNGSLMDQKLKIKIVRGKLEYTFEGWNFTDTGIIATPIKLIYEK